MCFQNALSEQEKKMPVDTNFLVKKKEFFKAGLLFLKSKNCLPLFYSNVDMKFQAKITVFRAAS